MNLTKLALTSIILLVIIKLISVCYYVHTTGQTYEFKLTLSKQNNKLTLTKEKINKLTKPINKRTK